MENRRISILLYIFQRCWLLKKIFTGITIHAKVLYGLLLDRMGMAVKNKWVDERNRMYVVYPIQEIQKDMGVTRKKSKGMSDRA